MYAIHIYTDGASRGNPGKASWAYAFFKEGEDLPFVKSSGYIGIATNNYAEYTAAIRALEKALELGYKDVVLHSDSQLLVNQLLGIYRVKSKNIKPLYNKVKELLKKFENYRIVHERRTHPFIKVVDKMCNEKLDEL